MAARYRIIRQIGSGGMGRVYLARDNLLERDVALKELRVPESFSDKEKSEMRERFQLEARAAARLSHPHIVTVHDIIASGDRHFIVMEYLNGKTLGDILSERVFSQDELLSIAPLLCDALGYAHSQGVIHRDIKPDNIFALENGNVKITDFGIAKLVMMRGVTQTGMITGTPQYVAPEIVRDRPYDHRVDIFSLGVTFYELLCGRPPFEADSDYAIIYKIASEEPVPLREKAPQVHAGLAAVIHRMLEKEPSLRYADMRELKGEFMALRQAMTDLGEAVENKEFDLERSRRDQLAESAASSLEGPVEYEPSGQFYFHRDRHWRERIAEVYRRKEEEKQSVDARLFPIEESSKASPGRPLAFQSVLEEASMSMGIGAAPAAPPQSGAPEIPSSPSRSHPSPPYARLGKPATPSKPSAPLAAPEKYRGLIAWSMAGILFCLLAILSVELTWISRFGGAPPRYGINYPEGIVVLILMVINLALSIALLVSRKDLVALSRVINASAASALAAVLLFLLVRLIWGRGIETTVPHGAGHLGETAGLGLWLALLSCLLFLISSVQASRRLPDKS